MTRRKEGRQAGSTVQAGARSQRPAPASPPILWGILCHALQLVWLLKVLRGTAWKPVHVRSSKVVGLGAPVFWSGKAREAAELGLKAPFPPFPHPAQRPWPPLRSPAESLFHRRPGTSQ